MAANGSLSHDGMTERKDAWCSKNSGPFVSSWAENVAMHMDANDKANAVIEQWKDSPGHRANMLKDMSLCAIAMVEGQGKFFFCQMFLLTNQ